MKNKNILLYHYTNEKISGTLTPRYFGNNSYTQNDVNACKVKRLFFYAVPKPEILLSGRRFLYTCRIAENKLYNITKDEAGYLKRYISLYEAVRHIAKKYSGVRYTLGNNEIINTFKAVKPFKIEALTQKSEA
jgi:hypothetical protein